MASPSKRRACVRILCDGLARRLWRACTAWNLVLLAVIGSILYDYVLVRLGTIKLPDVVLTSSLLSGKCGN